MHRDLIACYNIILRAPDGDGGNALSLLGLTYMGALVPLGSTATHEAIGVKNLWARWKPLDI